MKTKGVLFDYNGVIVDDEHLQEEAMHNVLKRFGVNLTPELYIEICLGRTDEEAFENLRQGFSSLANTTTSELLERKVNEYQHLTQTRSVLYPGIQDVLKNLRKYYKLAIVTGSLRVELEPVLENENIADFFEAVIAADDIEHGKPNPEGYLKGVAALDLAPEKIVVIEDTPSGVKAAKAAGLKCIAVEHTVPARQLQEADLTLENVTRVTARSIEELING